MTTFTPAIASADIGVYGLGVMGANLARNLARNGYRTAVFNRTLARTERLIASHGDGTEGHFVPAETLQDFVSSLSTPRVAIIMVQAGEATDAAMEQLAALMERGDIIVDCGNSLFTDTIRREKWASERGVHFVGAGVSGGEEGALWGPSIMPGGTVASYDRLGPMFETISAHHDGEPCCTHVGADGAGHFVKMVHNGIEYADMQVIAEAYDLLRKGLGSAPEDLAEIFASWNEGELGSYLIEITAEVLRHKDAATGAPLVDLVVDRSGQKGTGKWTVQTALDLAVPVTGIAEATFARGASDSMPQREAARALAGSDVDLVVTEGERDSFVEDVRQALFASKIIAYSQGFDLITAGAAEHGWVIDRGALAAIWREGCIIRAAFLDDITRAYRENPELPLLLAAEPFASRIRQCVPALRRVVARAAMAGVPVPVFASSLSYFDTIRAERLPAALIQGQRDYFGSHTYARVDKPGVFHTLWAAAGRPEEQWS
ncbi:NADP-dependent phosphogluconate dehydrogenase [Schaalia sp. 19OD2882]|uniref:NADP-dependent phosphogluconate dehydrogenase n=1 Tax=Schaalia sp. 19OD2882 TaxID=2794089 RepID=UPI001C1F1BB5|nr:NADP-dependent phosphogluconate dehydrogenase [Schaalia sp. 19OD2882]QWW19629.1 NADP-dependent phosphogluconate dehydrogenase [Schaalia sp. 19OD2882]